MCGRYMQQETVSFVIAKIEHVLHGIRGVMTRPSIIMRPAQVKICRVQLQTDSQLRMIWAAAVDTSAVSYPTYATVQR